jgi:hypothetical protein
MCGFVPSYTLTAGLHSDEIVLVWGVGTELGHRGNTGWTVDRLRRLPRAVIGLSLADG